MHVRTIRIRPQQARRWLTGCLALSLLLALVLGLGLVAGVAGLTGVLAHLFGRGDGGTVAPPGDPRAFDPVASYGPIARHAGAGAQLLSFEALQVRSDGRLDLQSAHRPGPQARYEFVRETAPPADAPPLGAGAPEDGRWWQQVSVRITRPGELHRVRRIGGGGQASYQYVNRGMQREEAAASARASGPLAPPPRCPLRALWAAAIARGAPAQAVATIEYGHEGYEFSIVGTRWAFEFDHDCRLRPRRRPPFALRPAGSTPRGMRRAHGRPVVARARGARYESRARRVAFRRRPSAWK